MEVRRKKSYISNMWIAACVTAGKDPFGIFTATMRDSNTILIDKVSGIHLGVTEFGWELSYFDIIERKEFKLLKLWR